MHFFRFRMGEVLMEICFFFKVKGLARILYYFFNKNLQIFKFFVTNQIKFYRYKKQAKLVTSQTTFIPKIEISKQSKEKKRK